jgi:hypothetical protein
MDSAALIAQIQASIQQIPELRKERQAIGSPKVKAWKTEVERLFRLGGKNTSKILQNFQNLRFGGGDTEVKFQAYLAEIDAAEKLLKSAVQTIQIFGVSEEQKLPDWFKQEVKAAGLIKIGSKEVDIKTVTVCEFLGSMLSLAESDKSLDETLRSEVRSRVEGLCKHPLLKPFLNQTIDKVFSKL